MKEMLPTRNPRPTHRVHMKGFLRWQRIQAGESEALEGGIDVALKCPKCHVTIEEGQTLCGNCKTEIAWKNGQPSLGLAQQLNQAGNSALIIGILILGVFWLFSRGGF